MTDELADILEQIARHGGLVVPLEVTGLMPSYQGCFESEVAYLRLELEIFVDPCVHWLLDCLDWRLVRDFFGDLRTLPLNDGAVVVLRCDDPPQ